MFVLVFCLPLFLFGCSEQTEQNHYQISAEYVEESKSLFCSERVKYVNNSSNVLNEVCFFLYPNSFAEGQKTVSTSYLNKAYPNGKSYGKITISQVVIGGNETEFEIAEAGNILTIFLSNELFPKESVSIDIQFTVLLANIRHRLGWSDKAVNFGNFFPIACVYEESGGFIKNQFSTNGDPFYSTVSSFDVEIAFPKDYVLASTGIQTEIQENNERKVVSCKANQVRDFCFVLSKNFEMLTANAGGVTVNYYFYEDEKAEEHLETAVKAIVTFNELFGEYPYQQISVVKTGFCFGGMEYPNLVMIADDIQGEDYDYVIVHEIAHQWWYGMVGNNEFQSAWVDEGLTEYATALFYEKNSEYGLKYETIMQNATESYQNFVRIYTQINGSVDESMNRNLNEFSTEPEYVNCTYTKGMLLFDSLRSTMSERKFFACLKNYFKEYCYKNSSPEKLIESFCKSSHINLEKFFEAWINGTVKIGG